NVPHGRPLRSGPDREGRGAAESLVAVAQQHAHGAVAVRGHDVLKAVAQEISNRHRVRRTADGNIDRVLQSAITFAQQHANGAVAVSRHDVERGGRALEVANRYNVRGRAQVEGNRGSEAGKRTVFQAFQLDSTPRRLLGHQAPPLR